MQSPTKTGGLWYTPTYLEGEEAATGQEILAPEPFVVESGTRQSCCGTTHNYELVMPSPPADGASHRPVVLLLHDWRRSSFEHRGTAEMLARNGLAVLMPELGRRNDAGSHATSVAALVDHCRWLYLRSACAEDRTNGCFDAKQVVLVGCGTGAAVVLDAASELQKCVQDPALPCPVGVLLLGPRPSSVIQPARLRAPRLFCAMQTLNADAAPGQVLGGQLPAEKLVGELGFDAILLTVLGAPASHETWESQKAVHTTGDLLRTIFPTSVTVDAAVETADDGKSPFGSSQAPIHKMLVQSLVAAFAADACGLDEVAFDVVLKYYVDKGLIELR
eukprot:COSAG02_NODE_5968_length_3902_cov_5.539574_2_plen_333_part_00